MRIEPNDYDAMSAWVRRVLALPFKERIVLVDPPRGAAPPAEAWQVVERLADPESTDLDAKARLAKRMPEWAELYLTREGRRCLSAVLRQRRYRRRAESVTIDIPRDVQQALMTVAASRCLSLADLRECASVNR